MTDQSSHIHQSPWQKPTLPMFVSLLVLAKYNLTVYRDNFPWHHCLLWAPYKHRGEECTKSSGMPGEGQILMFHKMNLSTWCLNNECIFSVISFIF